MYLGPTPNDLTGPQNSGSELFDQNRKRPEGKRRRAPGNSQLRATISEYCLHRSMKRFTLVHSHYPLCQAYFSGRMSKKPMLGAYFEIRRQSDAPFSDTIPGQQSHHAIMN